MSTPMQEKRSLKNGNQTEDESKTKLSKHQVTKNMFKQVYGRWKVVTEVDEEMLVVITALNLMWWYIY